MDKGLNISIRKFLKEVGVTSQQAIESALRNSTDSSVKRFEAKMVLTITSLKVEHTVTGEIEG